MTLKEINRPRYVAPAPTGRVLYDGATGSFAYRINVGRSYFWNDGYGCAIEAEVAMRNEARRRGLELVGG